jgi:hypothetical protein
MSIAAKPMSLIAVRRLAAASGLHAARPDTLLLLINP